MTLSQLKSRGLRSANTLLASAGVRLERTTRHRSLMDFLQSRQVDVVYDVGANQGQFGLALREEGYKGRIVSFEPLARAYAMLAAVARHHPPWDTFNLGLSDRAGSAEINVSEYSVFSSLNAVTSHAQQFNERSKVIGVEQIKLQRLDDVFQVGPENRPFLKVDTQGHEQNVLKGADHCLPRFVGVQMELPAKHLYQGVWHLDEALAFMRLQGFGVSNFIPTNFDGDADPVSAVELDCVFKNERFPFQAAVR